VKLVRKLGLVETISEMSGSGRFLEMTPLGYSAAGVRFVLRRRRKAHHSATSIRFSRFPVIIGMLLFALGFCAGRTLYGASVKETKGKETNRVLILYSFDKEEDFFYGFDRTLRSSLASKLSGRVEFYTEYVDLVRFPEARHAEILAKLLKLKLSQQKPDLIIAVSYPAINFLLETGKDLFPETPIVFSCVGDSFGENLKTAIARAGRHNVSGILLGNQQVATLKLAFQLQPGTQKVLAVAGTTPLEKFWVNQLEKDLALSQPAITFTYLSNMSMDEILKKVAALPPHTVIYYPYFFLDANGSLFSPEEALDLISGAADVPIYGSFHSYIGHGLVGGQMLDFEDVAAKTAEDASRALRQEQTPGPEFAVDSTSSITVDWRQLRRWNISESRLPPGTVVLFKEKSLLDRYRWYILGVVTLCFCEAILILALLIQGTRRKRAEEALRESEERLRLAVQAGRMYAFEWDMASDVIERTGQSRDILNWMDDPMRDTGRQFIARVHPDDREAYAATETGRTPDNPYYQTGYRMLRPDGGVVWLEESGHAFFDGKGKMLRIIGMVLNVTERKLAEEALASVSRRLIEAQERERARIARELHDDIGQRLALLSIELEQLRQISPDLPAEVHSRVGVLREQALGIATDVQSLSHDLHSSKLEYLGIVMAMRGFCREFSEQQNVEIEFKTHDLPRPLSPDVSLCLFRVLQEALHNSAKYSGVQHFEVRLWGTSDEIYLTVSDSGAGFDVEAAKGGRGLGLVSMGERVRLLKGTLSIESQPKHGTTIHACVPLSKVARAAG
jgi:PAS domain S-box-containing protein